VGALIFAVSAFTAGRPLRPDASTQAVIVHFNDKRTAVIQELKMQRLLLLRLSQ
jgi:hypothetical protein